MSNPTLSKEQLNEARKVLKDLMVRIHEISNGDERLVFAYRRKLYKELMYLERGKPALRRKLKELKYKEQKGVCTECQMALELKESELDRSQAMLGYTPENTRLIHHKCHRQEQARKNYA
jgi:hypothetical protein